MDKRKAFPTIKAEHFGKTHKDLIDSFTKKQNQPTIEKLQEQSNRTLKKIVKDKRKQRFEVTKNDITLTDTNGGNFGNIDEFSPSEGIGQIKTISNNDFKNIVINKGKSEDYAELNALMHNSKVGKGYVHYVNEDNPFMQATIRHKYDASKYTQDLNKVKRVQSFVEKKMFTDSSIQTYSAQTSKFSSITESNFASNFVKLQEYKEQSIVQAGIKSNNPFMRNMRRENRTVIEGMKHGWFGKTRHLRTPFGSPQRLGSYEDALALSSSDLDSMFDESWGLDLETKGLEANHNSILEAGIRRGSKSKALFMHQKTNFNLHKEAPFLAQSGFGDFAKKIGLDFTKTGEVQNFNQQIRAYHNSFKGTVEANVTNTTALMEEIDKFVYEAKAKKKPIYIQNANFEIRQLDALYAAAGKVNPLNYSTEYLELRSEISRSNKSIFKDVKNKKLSSNEGFNKLLENQKTKYLHVLNEAIGGGAVADIQEIGRTLNAVTQSKDLQLKTGRFGANTNIDYLAKIFLDESEVHEAVLDLHQQEIVGKRMTQAIGEIETGNITSPYTKKFVESNKLNAIELYTQSMRKGIVSELKAGGDPYKIKNLDQLDIEGLDRGQLFDKVLAEVKTSEKSSAVLKTNSVLGVSNDKLRKARVGSLLFGGILLGSAVTNLFTFSGRDDQANTIEGLQHGSPNQNQRQYNTSFGSGYRAEKFEAVIPEQEDDKAMTFKQLGLTGLGVAGAYGVFKHQASKMRLNDLSYIGKLSPAMDNEALLGRNGATAQDIAVAGVRRMENTLGGFGKALGVGDAISIGMYDSATFSVDLKTKEGETYAAFMNKMLNRKLVEEGVDSLMFKKGELFERVDGQYRKIEGKFSLLKTVTNHDLSDSISPLAKSAAYQKGIRNTGDLSKFPFLILGGKGDWKAAGDWIDSFIHESMSKPMKLLADPLEAVRELFPDLDVSAGPKIKKLLSNKYMPDIGLDGGELVQSYGGMLKQHGVKLATFGAMAYFGLGTLNWGAQTLAPDGNPIGDAGLIGGGAYALRKLHEGYARLSDITGLTSLRNTIEEKAPGSDGWQSTVGLTLSGAMFGGLYGGIQDLTKEATATNKYKAFIANKDKTEEFSGVLKKVFKEKYTKTGKAMRIGGGIGFLAALPFTLAGLGAESSASELAAEYSGDKEVAIKKGRFWESGFTPWEGGEIDYYRKNWYAKLMDNAKEKELYGENISPLTEAARSLLDPYWLEKRRYHDQPYPITGPDGSMMGIFGPAYEASIGRILKPVARMHESVLPEELLNNTEYDAEALLRKQWNSTLEFMGLRGFAVKAIKENITGSQEIFADPNEARSAKDIDSVVRDFYDLQIGGGMLTSEALRRVFQNSDSFQKAQLGANIDLNPLRNKMPSWMPGSEYVTDFKSGDPFNKVKDGYYRLPGKGFASKYKELEGVNPEDYQDIYKYKILSDVAYGSTAHRIMKGKLQNRPLTEYEQNIFDEVQNQVEEKKESEMLIRDAKSHDSFLGRYSNMLTDFARSNPLETLLPISPAHKFLGPPDLEDYMDEKRYSKDYRSWSNPVDDFVLPAVSMTMNSLGLGGIDMNSDQNEIDGYFDKVDYVKFSNLAREAQASGDLKLADQYTVMAQKTYTGKDLYTHSANVASALPSSERTTFNYFVAADVVTKQKMIQKVNPQYRDAYQAQLDMQLRQQAESSRISDGQRNRTLREIESRQRSVEARRKADIQDARSNMPGSDWSGWSQESNTGNVKQKYMNNKARDYHDYQPRRSSRSADADSMAAGQIPVDIAKPASYSSHYSELNKSGVENALVVLRPGLDNSAKVSIKVDRRKERNDALRSWGYTK